MNILYIITQADGGGAQQYVLALAKHFNGAIAAGDEAKKLFDDARDLQLATYSLQHLKRNINPWHDFWVAWEIRKLIKSLKPDIVHLNSTKAGVLGSFAAIGLKKKAAPRTGQQGWTGTRVVYTAHGFVFNEPLPFWLKTLYAAAEKTASDFRDLIIAVSEADRQSALKLNLIKPNKIITIHNGIAPIVFLPRDSAREVLCLPPHPTLPLEGGGIKGEGDKFIFGTIANYYKTKGLDVLISAVGLLPIDIKGKCLFALIGSGPEEEKLKATSYKLKANFKFLGKIDNAKKYLKAFDAFVLPSRKEGFSYTLLEAMQAGLPTIASDVGGTKEALGNCGILVPPENPKALADAIQKIFADQQLRECLSKQALLKSKEFTLEKMLEKTSQVYRQA